MSIVATLVVIVTLIVVVVTLIGSLSLSSHFLLNSASLSPWVLLLLHLIIPALILLVSATGGGPIIIIVVVPSLLQILGVLTSVIPAEHSYTSLTVEVSLTTELLGWVAIWVLVVISSAWSVHSNKIYQYI